MNTAPPPPEAGLPEPKAAELRYAALLEDWKEKKAADLKAEAEERQLVEKRRDEQLATEDALRAAVHGAYLDVAKAALERSLQRATFVTGAAGTMATIYSGLLALVYSVAKDSISPMPASGIGAAAFLGLSLVLSTAYVAFIDRTFHDRRHLRSGLGSPRLQEERLGTFLDWSIGSSFRRAWALRTSVFSLGIGVALTPVPFLELTEPQRWRLIALGGGILLVTLVYELVRWGRSKATQSKKNTAPPAETKPADRGDFPHPAPPG